ncbi:hypothetical protein CK621_00100 [Vandammella animalimorsus]|uniref:Uncharacterized protein n=1 Tax=Vandammella animalimorsus TaxID=2029117 RepID=A0A2A2B1Q3_9BURK|nr:hypothetical protein CK621_00100 [Vandammella animalimorsus]
MDWADIKTALFRFCTLASGGFFLGACKLRMALLPAPAGLAGAALQGCAGGVSRCRQGLCGRRCGWFWRLLRCAEEGLHDPGFRRLRVFVFWERGDLRAGQRAQGR